MSELTELLERFRRGAELVAVVTTGAAGPELDFRPGPEKWSIRQVVGHLADSEMVGACRLRSVLAEDNPTLQWYDEKAWAERLDYQRRKFSQTLETFRRIRAENYELVKELPGEAWSRPATHSRFGAMTLLDVLRTYAEHAEGHARQIRELREAFKQSRK